MEKAFKKHGDCATHRSPERAFHLLRVYKVFLQIELSETRAELHMFRSISCTFSGSVLDFKQLKSQYNTLLSKLFWALDQIND